MSRIYYFSLFFVSIVCIAISFWFGISADEIDMHMLGKYTLDYLSSFGSDQTIFNIPKEFDRDGVMKYYGGAFELFSNIICKIIPMETYSLRHILILLSALGSIFISSRICIKLSGYTAGLICVWLMSLFPFFIGNAMNNSKDIPFAFAYILAVYSIIKFTEKDSNYQLKDYIFIVLPIALAINIRIAGLLLLGYLPISIFLKLALTGQLKILKNYIKPVLIVMVASYFVSSLIWPFGLQNPVSNPLEALKAFTNFKVSLNQLYEGQKIMSSEFPRFFILKAIYLTLTIPFIAGIFLFVYYMIMNKQKKSQYLILFVLFTVVFPVSYIIYSKSNIYHLWRHSLFIFPSLAILVALGWSNLIESQGQKIVKYVCAAALVLGLAEPLYFMTKNFPHFICYFNPISGGFNKNYGMYETDFYYNSLKQSSDWFLKNEYPKVGKDQKIIVASNAVHVIGQYLKTYKNIELKYVRFNERDQHEYDYSIFHIGLVPVSIYSNNVWLNKNVIFKSGIGDKYFNIVSRNDDKNDYYGKKALDSQNYPKAVDFLTKALQFNPNNEIAWTNLGFAQLNSNQPNEAVQSLSSALKISPESMMAKNYLAYAYLQSGNLPYAQSVLMNLIEENPNNPDPYRLLAQIYQQQGNGAMAQQYMNYYQQIMAQMGGQ
jgi:tetratricopeptide (TPR) repeat protein